MRFLNILLLFTIITLVSGCKNDFSTIGDWKDIPIVFAVIAKSDTAHYIRVEKAFLNEDGNAFDIAQIPDSFYYSSLDVKMINTENENEEIQFYRVNGDDEGLFRKEGDFISSPNYLYKYKFPEDESFANNKIYRLEINRGDNLPLVTAETTILGNFTVSTPTPGDNVNVDDTSPFNVRFGRVAAADEYDVKLIFYYDESLPGNPNEFVEKSVQWQFGSGKNDEFAGSLISADHIGREFYQFLGNKIDPTSNLIRFFKRFEFKISQSGADLIQYIDVTNANTGITSSQVIPDWSNLSEGRGVFASGITNTFEYGLKSVALDSLRNGQYTFDLNFQ